jgi:hypothetical protein
VEERRAEPHVPELADEGRPHCAAEAAVAKYGFDAA